LLYLLSGEHVLVTSAHILGELERVLSYPRLLKRSALSPKDIVDYLENLAAVSYLVQPETVPEDVLRDPTDGPIAGTALAGKADVLCTRDADLFDERAQRFCSAHGIRVMTDLEFISKFEI
jgi:putative PIN family toxin of toxin-antitoxin system